MIANVEISKRLFVAVIIAIGIAPRHHIDRSRLSLGGDLSRPFKKLLVAHAVGMILRVILRNFHTVKIVMDVLGFSQQVGLIFLCFLTPYLLRSFLVGSVNLRGGRPAAALMTPLYLATALTAASYVLSRAYGAHFWSVKKLANACSVPVIIETLKLYNSVMTRGDQHIESRGTIISQTMYTMEVCYMIIQCLCAVGFLFGTTPPQGQWDEFCKAFRDIGFYADWLRVGTHAIFVNQLDEAYLLSARSPSAPGQGDGNAEASTQLVPLVANRMV